MPLDCLGPFLDAPRKGSAKATTWRKMWKATRN